MTHSKTHLLSTVAHNRLTAPNKFETCHTLLLRFDAPLPVLKIPAFPLYRTWQQYSP